MKIKITIGLIVLLFITCAKENTSINQTQASTQSNAVAVIDERIPLNDLGTGTYMGYTGGLYPGGANNPSGQYATDLLQISGSIVPIDTIGNSSSNGKIAWISLGASIGGKNMKAMITKTKENPATNPKLLLMNGNDGGVYASLTSIMTPSDPYWLKVNKVIKRNRSSFRQIQVVYLETDDGVTTKKFPDRPTIIKSKIEACARTIKQKFPNIKVLYVLGRTRTFNNARNNATPWNTEPSPYYFGWGCKWAIEDQINGVSGTEYKGSNKVAPIITWGFYQWADSLPRKTDNFYWRFTETKDGLHSNDAGEDTLATRFQKFLLSDINSKQWYAKP
jgi:hypothetical protein